jgi:hypothetical protein
MAKDLSPKLKGFLWFTALGISIYWTLVFSGTFPVTEIKPGYTDWFLSFPVADSWISVASLGALYFAKKDRAKFTVALSAAGSGLIFLGLYAFTYGFRTGLIFNLTTDMAIEIAIKIYCLSVGSWFIRSAFKGLQNGNRNA